MGLNFTTLYKLPVKFLLLVAVICTCFNAEAQKRHTKGVNYDGGSWDGGSGGGSAGGMNSTWGVAVNLGYDVPGTNLSESFKATPAYGLHILYNWKSFTFNLSGGYHAYSPKQDTVFLLETDPELGYMKWSAFKVFEFYTGAAWNVVSSETMKVYVGANLGSYYTSYELLVADTESEVLLTRAQQNIYMAPKLGAAFMLTESIALGFEAKYNFFTPGGSWNSQTGGTSYGESYSSYTANVLLSYHF